MICQRCGIELLNGGFERDPLYEHTDARCADRLAARLREARECIEAALEVSRDRQAFMMQGPRGWARAEQVLQRGLAALDAATKGGGT